MEFGQVPARVLQEMVHSLDGTETEKGLVAIAVPTLLLWGDRDGLFTRAEQDRLLERIGGAHLTV
jgi:pimeloyl-ACP methyl ester carboxylesterase